MTDPLTIGLLAAAALKAGAEALGREAVGATVKDAYAALKKLVAQWAHSDADALEEEAKAGDDTTAREQLVARAIDKRSEDELAKVKGEAERLLTALREAVQAGQPVGIDIGRLEALEVHLGHVDVSAGKGFRADEVKTGVFSTNGVRVGPGNR